MSCRGIITLTNGIFTIFQRLDSIFLQCLCTEFINLFDIFLEGVANGSLSVLDTDSNINTDFLTHYLDDGGKHVSLFGVLLLDHLVVLDGNNGEGTVHVGETLDDILCLCFLEFNGFGVNYLSALCFD